MPEAVLLSAPAVAARLSVSLRTVRCWQSSGKIPAPLKIGRRCLWSADELAAWIAAGCPTRTEWVARQAAKPAKRTS